MPGSQMGDMLRGRREELGVSLDMAAAATNIRSRVLAVIENGDYANFPPYGHALGMISSYARYLETDPRPILQEFEREWAGYEAARDMARSAERARRGVGRFGERVSAPDRPSQRPGRGRGADRGTRAGEQPVGAIHAKLDDERAAEGDDRYKSGTVKVVGHRQTGSFRRVGGRTSRAGTSPRPEQRRAPEPRYEAEAEPAPPRTRPDGAVWERPRANRGASPAPRRSSRAHATGPADGSRARGTRADGGVPDFFSPEALDRRERAANRASRPRRRGEVSQGAPDDDSLVARVTASVSEAFSERRVRLIASGVAALIIVVAIAAGVLISTAGNSESGIMPIEGGAADTTKTTGDPNSASATVTTTNGNPVNVTIDVGQGQTSLVNVTYDDDNAYSGTAVGPWHREFLVTESLEATFGNPDAVTVTENGQPVNIARDDSGTGGMSLTIKTTSTSTSAGSSAEKKGSGKSDKKSSKDKSASSSSS